MLGKKFWITLISLTGFFFLPLHTSAIEYGGIGGRPAYPQPNIPRSDSIFIHTVSPGQTYSDAVTVINNTPETKTLLIYPADYLPSTDGGYACKQLAETNLAVGSWITLAKSEVALESMATEIVPFTIAVPNELDIGEHNGCLLIQEKKPPQSSTGINLSFRTGLRIALTVPGEVIKKLDIEGFEIITTPLGNYLLKPSLKNYGNVSLDADVSVSITDLLGRTIYSNGGTYSVTRGRTSAWNYEFNRPLFGGWFTTTFTATYKDNQDQTISLSALPLKFYAPPTPAGLAILITTSTSVIILTVLVILRRRTNRRRFADWVEFTVQANDNLPALAQRFGVHWQTLAKHNQLSPPYLLVPGQILKVPPHDHA